ncbi:IclR family transcriptional regulator [Paraburkholderia fungorum]|uniref:IclR family transcriptional regulator n=1 Tax=Paraburkholderia fungorum TaxID=134537 RepID=UPI002092024E|nr:IclR family transcriptional regulator [Paraburkholderia fungorum]USU18628.1 IclR family transcriptional regulator [Paraburkholderia fungorum]USU29378.1 IclR family transcriptional regulator [Paraburkholderia fungorum]
MTPDTINAERDADDDRNDADASSEINYRVPGLERGLKILTEFSPREPVLGAPELSKRLKIPRTTVFRLLQTLESLGFLERADKDRNYRLGVAVLRLGFEYLSSLELTDLGLPIIEALRNDTGLTSHIVIRDGRDVVFVAKAQSHAPIFSSVKVNVGTRLPAYATTHGQVLMSDMTLDELKKLYPEPELERFTKQTPATVEELYERVCDDARRGYAISESSFERGISVVSAPVRNDTGRIVAVITTTIPRPEIDASLLDSGLIDKVRRAADELSQRLNYRPKGSANAGTKYMKALGLK